MYRNDLTRVRHMLDYSERAIAYTRGRTRADLEEENVPPLITQLGSILSEHGNKGCG
jgi:hypothetical protein